MKSIKNIIKLLHNKKYFINFTYNLNKMKNFKLNTLFLHIIGFLLYIYGTIYIFNHLNPWFSFIIAIVIIYIYFKYYLKIK